MAAIRMALSAALARPALLLVLGAGNLAVLALVYLWLGLPDASVAQLAVSAAVLLMTLSLWLVLLGGTMAAFHPLDQPGLGAAFMGAMGRLPRLWLVAVPFVAALALGAWWSASAGAGAKATAPAGKALLQYMPALLIPLLFAALAPLLSQSASAAYSFRQARAVFARGAYWLGWLAFVLLGLLVPAWLVSAVFPSSSLAVEAISAAVRFMLGYLLHLICTLMLAALISRLAAESVS